MRSSDLLVSLARLPASQQGHGSARKQIDDIVANDRVLSASEFAASLSLGLWGVWDRINVPDSLAEAYAAQYPGSAASHSLFEQWESMQAAGLESSTGFISGLKGKLAELKAIEILDQNGYTNVNIADNPVQPGWDISAVNEAGETVLYQVKTGSEAYASSVTGDMQADAGLDFMVGSELHNAITDSSPELADRLIDIGTDLELVEGVSGGLETLSNNLGLDIVDSVGELLPIAGSLFMAVSLIRGALNTELHFRDVDRTDKNKIQVIQALTLMSRFGITAFLTWLTGISGTLAGSSVPGIGNLVGGIFGSLLGGVAGWRLNRRLSPHMLNLALDITGLNRGDLFYFNNKKHIDDLGQSFRNAADYLDEWAILNTV